MRFAAAFASESLRQRLAAKMPILAPSVLGLTNSGTDGPDQSPSAAISISPSISRVGGTQRPAAEASARLANLSWARCDAAAGLPDPAETSRRERTGTDEPRSNRT